jgi:hypothetical protein
MITMGACEFSQVNIWNGGGNTPTYHQLCNSIGQMNEAKVESQPCSLSHLNQ